MSGRIATGRGLVVWLALFGASACGDGAEMPLDGSPSVDDASRRTDGGGTRRDDAGLGRDGGPIVPPEDAVADWRARTSGPGVVWFHDFDTTGEVDAFRWRGGQGDDPENTGDGSMRHVADDGITPGCLEIYTAAGTEADSAWWRPLSPIVGSGNGRGSDDPGASGAIEVRDYAPDPAPGASAINAWGSHGIYGPAEYHGDGGFDGTEFYLQMRVKISASRFERGTAERGKLFYLSHTYRSLTGQEIVTQNNQDHDLMVYHSGSPPLPPSQQHGSELGELWGFPADEWVTFYVHVVPGHDGEEDTEFQAWIARADETAYTKVWDTNVVPLSYDYDRGQNAIILSSYMNGVTSDPAWSVRFDQLIFSQEPIEAPQWVAP